MATAPVYSGTTSNITYTPTSTNNSTANGSSNKSTANDTLASNFTTFLQLLTTQLQNQNPLDPLDTNQFTQQLVQFAQVEQQLKSNDQLATLVSIQQATQSTQALAFVGTTVAVDGATTPMVDGKAAWTFVATKPSTATVVVTDASGQTVYTGSYTVQSGPQAFIWDGRDASGHQWPDGPYKLSVTAKDTNGQTVAVSTEVEGKVDSVDLTQSPPLLWVSGQTYTVDKVKRVTKAADQT